MRGEYIKRGKIFSDGLGSPPLARGIPWCQIRRHFMTGITPACAGNTIKNLRGFSGQGDHPRLRGEYHSLWRLKVSCIGSPPLARGILSESELSPIRDRITPACAGNTRYKPSEMEGDKDHPRLRGEYCTTGEIDCTIPGSPPLARGIRCVPFDSFTCNRITPACAGNT